MAGAQGRRAADLSDAELEEQGTHVHATRNWVFLHGTAEQFAHHTARMLELEQEYLTRFPKRTWQGVGHASAELDEASRLRLALRGIQRQIDALLRGHEHEHDEQDAADASPAQVHALLGRVTAAGGRMHKLELHQAARDLGVGPAALAALYRGPHAALRADRDERVLVRDDAAGAPAPTSPAEPDERHWQQETRPRWDTDKQELFATVPQGVFDLDAELGADLLGDWWSLRGADGAILGYGWMDSSWGGDVEVLLAVHGAARQRGLGSDVLDRLEKEAAERGINYVYNTVRDTHPERQRLHDWLAVRGYRGSDSDQALRKRVTTAPSSPARPDAEAARAPHPPAGPVASASDRGPGHEEAGGYVDVDEHRY